MRKALCLLAIVLALPAALAAADSSALMVAQVGSLSVDEQIMFAALQGIVNRSAPHIYLEGLDQTAPLWLSDAVPLASQSVANPYDLLLQFQSQIQGMVVWDPALQEDTRNVATTVAGLRGYLPVSPALAARLDAPPYNFKVKTDLRNYGFKTRDEAYLWALKNLGPSSQYAFPAWMGGGNPPNPGLRDWVVARKGFAFDADPTADAALVTRILKAFPPATSVFGYPFFGDAVYGATGVALAEPQAVGEISRRGDWLIPSDSAANLTVHSSFAPAPQSTLWDDSPRPPDPTQTYITFVISDGDNLGYDEQALRTLHWDDLARAGNQIPMGISISPWLAVYAPNIYAWYVRNLRANEVLVAGPSGAGYAYPSEMPNLDQYLDNTRPLMALAGLRSLWLLDDSYAYSPLPTTTRRYVEELHASVIFAYYGFGPVPYPPALTFQDGVPIVHSLFLSDTSSNSIGRIQLTALTSATHPAFIMVGLSTWTMGYTQAAQVMAALGAGYKAVRPDEFTGLLRGSGMLLSAE